MEPPLTIPLRGVRVHNLRGIDADIPLGRLTVVTGVSGAGKSSLVFDVLYAEAQRRYLQSFSAYTRQFLQRFDRPDAESIGDLPPALAVGFRPPGKNPRATVGTLTDIHDLLALLFSRLGVVHCLRCGQAVRAQQPADVVVALESFRAGTRVSVAFPSSPETPEDGAAWSATLREQGFVRVQVSGVIHHLGERDLPALEKGAVAWVLVDRIETGKAVSARLTDSIETAFAQGAGRMALVTDDAIKPFDRRLVCPRCDIVYPVLEPRLFHFNNPLGACPDCRGAGVVVKTQQTCPTCGGARLSEQAQSVRVAGKTLADVCTWDLDKVSDFLGGLSFPEGGGADRLVAQMQARLQLLRTLALNHLTLGRSAVTLSPGEVRRLHLTTALASNLVGAMYLLDEPTAGLHPRDIHNLIGELLKLRAAGNTLVAVTHELELIRHADHIIDLGPGAGEEGGRVVYQGMLDELLHSDDSITAEYLTSPRSLYSGGEGPGMRGPSLANANPLPPNTQTSGTVGGARRPTTAQPWLKLSGASLHNLKEVTVEFPLGVLCAVAGVSGAGKSSLVVHTLYPALLEAKGTKADHVPAVRLTGAGQVDDVILIDQAPLGRSTRSSPASYLKIYDEVRELFAETSEARIRNFGPGTFSYNQAGGRCDACEGQGTLSVDMQFLADVTMTCPECQGKRFKRDVLNVTFRSLNIADVLNLTAHEAFRFFRAQPKIQRRLKVLLDLGLDYLRLGQAADTLSSGEGQRLKLAAHLALSRKSRSLFLLIEPTTGLHPADVETLLTCFDGLVQAGHSLIVVEHSLALLSRADYIIDMGPEGGAAGGRIVAAGTPEQIAQVETSHTGRCLRPFLVGSQT